MPTPIVNIIILNWNGSDDTISCLDSLCAVTYDNYKIILIDNGSCDDSVERLTDYLAKQVIDFSEKITFIQSQENLGFAKGCNLGMKYVQEKGYGSLVLLLNNDTEVTPDFLSLLVGFYHNHPGFYALAPQIRLFYDKERIWNCGGKIKGGNKQYFYQNAETQILPNIEYLETSFLTGCALLMDFEKTGMLSERFFYGEEDFEFSLRLQSKKMKTACVLSSIIYHKVGRSIKKRSDNSIALSHIHYLNRLIDYKTYTKSLLYYKMWTIYNMIDLFFYLRKDNALSFSYKIHIIRDIVKDSKENSNVDKDLFLHILSKYTTNTFLNKESGL